MKKETKGGERMKERFARAARWLGHNRGLCALLAAGCAAEGLFLLLRGSRQAMDRAAALAMKARGLVSAAADLLPFSLAEALCTALGVWLLVMAAATVRARLGGRRVLARRLLGLAALAVWIAAGVSWLWGVHYYAASFSEKSGLAAAPVTTEALKATTLWFAEGANRAGSLVERDEAGRLLADSAAILAAGTDSLAALAEEYPFLDGPARRPKPALYSWFMSAAGFTGYIFPFTGESTLNLHCPNVFLPVTIAHEQAHQRGVAPEQEANFVGVAACLANGDALWQYSGWLFGFLHLSNALYSADPAAWQEVWQLLEAGPVADLLWNDEYWLAFEGPVEELAGDTYTAFLESYGQDLGMASYGACMDLLVARYGPLAAED